MKKILMILWVLLFLSFPVFASDLEVTWNPNAETDLAGYKVFYGNATGVYSNSVDVGKVTTYLITNVTQGKTYYVSLKAYDTSNNLSEFSAEVSLYVPIPDTTPPSVPVNLVATITGTVVGLKWDAIADATTYGVYDNGVLVASVTKAEYVSGSSTQGQHKFTVDAMDAANNRSAQSLAKIITIDTMPPNAPTGLKLKLIQLLTWLKLHGHKV